LKINKLRSSRERFTSFHRFSTAGAADILIADGPYPSKSLLFNIMNRIVCVRARPGRQDQGLCRTPNPALAPPIRPQ